MNILFHLFLTHFVADYPLQPRKLVEYKKKTYLGVLLHCAIHLATIIVVLIPFLHLKSVWIGITFIFVTHNIIDQSKILIERKYKNFRLPLYLLDQVLHLLVIALVANRLGVLSPNLPDWAGFYADRSVVLYAVILVVTTYFYDVTRYFVRTRKKAAPYKRDYKMMLWNVFIVSIAFAVYWMAY